MDQTPTSLPILSKHIRITPIFNQTPPAHPPPPTPTPKQPPPPDLAKVLRIPPKPKHHPPHQSSEPRPPTPKQPPNPRTESAIAQLRNRLSVQPNEDIFKALPDDVVTAALRAAESQSGSLPAIEPVGAKSIGEVCELLVKVTTNVNTSLNTAGAGVGGRLFTTTKAQMATENLVRALNSLSADFSTRSVHAVARGTPLFENLVQCADAVSQLGERAHWTGEVATKRALERGLQGLKLLYVEAEGAAATGARPSGIATGPGRQARQAGQGPRVVVHFDDPVDKVDEFVKDVHQNWPLWRANPIAWLDWVVQPLENLAWEADEDGEWDHGAWAADFEFQRAVMTIKGEVEGRVSVADARRGKVPGVARRVLEAARRVLEAAREIKVQGGWGEWVKDEDLVKVDVK